MKHEDYMEALGLLAELRDSIAAKKVSSMDVQAKVKAVREILGLTIPEFAAGLGMDDRSIRRWEEDGTPPHLSNVLHLAYFVHDKMHEQEDEEERSISNITTQHLYAVNATDNIIPHADLLRILVGMERKAGFPLSMQTCQGIIRDYQEYRDKKDFKGQ